MAYAVYSVTAAAPSLFRALRKIAHTPRPRLEVGYRPVPYRDVYAHEALRTEVRGLRPLGNALYLDRLLAAGNVGDALPLANRRIEAMQDPTIGAQLDVWA